MAASGNVLVVEDNDTERRAVCQILKVEGYTVHGVESADKAVGYLNEKIDVVVSDVHLGGPSGMALMNLWKKKNPHARFILITGQANVPDAVEAIKAGAYDYLCKPLSREKLSVLVKRALESIEAEKKSRSSQRVAPEIVGSSNAMKAVIERIRRVAPVDSSVLILGENGTGKELVAEALHRQSRRANGPFVAMNVSAVPATLIESEMFGHVRGAFTGATDQRMGRFEQANGGTLFIDEIGDFDLALQPKLLRVVETLRLTPVGGHEDRKVDVRVIAATSRRLPQMVRDGVFREDLFYRLNVVQIEIPPLRHRREDVAALVEHFLDRINKTLGGRRRRLSAALLARLMDYTWPGNARELHNTLESMIVMADHDELTEADLPAHIAGRGAWPSARSDAPAPQRPAAMSMVEVERLNIVQALRECNDNRTHAAQKLGISVRTLQRKLHLYGMAATDLLDDAGTKVTRERHEEGCAVQAKD